MKGNYPLDLGPEEVFLKIELQNYFEIDEKLFNYVRIKRRLKKFETLIDLGKHARRLAKEEGNDDFKASNGYISKFLERFSKSLIKNS